jgi:hypothetical protein
MSSLYTTGVNSFTVPNTLDAVLAAYGREPAPDSARFEPLLSTRRFEPSLGARTFEPIGMRVEPAFGTLQIGPFLGTRNMEPHIGAYIDPVYDEGSLSRAPNGSTLPTPGSAAVEFTPVNGSILRAPLMETLPSTQPSIGTRVEPLLDLSATKSLFDSRNVEPLPSARIIQSSYVSRVETPFATVPGPLMVHSHTHT